VMQGKGLLKLDGDERALEPGDIIWAPPNELHQFQNAGSEPFFFMCRVPILKK
jgi:quercetin dioxygenase-like cupin family protein